MDSFFSELFSIIPFWLFAVCVAGSLFLGRGIRWWLDRRKALEEVEKKKQRKVEKAQRKRKQKQLKKAARNRK
ncbi:MAG: hypothetical protein FWG74_02350 [Planctomycetes bacterium]|nr:hypothetical protein [Planctomycetota bacterium]